MVWDRKPSKKDEIMGMGHRQSRKKVSVEGKEGGKKVKKELSHFDDGTKKVGCGTCTDGTLRRGRWR